ncbi:hypothetical protein CPAST_c05790 [Clostridium pasteurianum DSM 525 = ATCC 6013]|uniref:DUF4878 domain-containing protein n=1 Tax=Clostridium pasteurianum DSM 525 = ATCC 6013 TaxID=1262449 RepID=A0A0H3J035_CLOPA|nr:hypothetical protein [Clostridium pasteurianum]AJA46679.1 hypothetical protein CPAST_c05790 [Clostridium pasteurianum DSM 525 = ATCC 6013]AJA50667.1 hypothetical protein CLPA_c05790 [Clostridium pasteurianum DSM 525 = ATCC 6013]AOZ74087.1 hypothetical protein AQ983_02780 [Clostridium pasteurianum DSM 525 = ATCC 6013]AOZ77884.1 hypothetical protein AQ984_02780 [Clostridium pasteurianum]ELP61244.1 beta2-toxin [Clostridium pasteurianum DSM 525 = ATCC 6013]
MKKFKFRITSLIIALIALIIPQSVVIAAPITSSQNTLVASGAPQNTLSEYLTALQSLNYDKALSLYTDSRAANDATKSTILKQVLSDPNNQIKSFNILDTTIEQSDSLILLATIEFKNGQVSQIPFKLQNSNESWLVKIGSDLPLPSEYKLLKQGTEIKNTEITPNSTYTTSSQRATFNFLLSSVDPYGPDQQYSSNFSASGSVMVNFRQWQDYGTANIEYAIVKWGLFSDTVYSSGSVYENNEGYGDQIYLSVPSVSGVCLRVKHLNPQYTAHSYGEVYN